MGARIKTDCPAQLPARRRVFAQAIFLLAAALAGENTPSAICLQRHVGAPSKISL